MSTEEDKKYYKGNYNLVVKKVAQNINILMSLKAMVS